MTKDEALKMAIEAMNSAYSSHGKILTSNPAQDAWLYHGCDAKLFKAIQACKEALEQPAQEVKVLYEKNGIQTCEILPAPSWQGLSDDEILEIDKSIDPEISIGKGKTLFARAIEQELKTKNGFSALKEKNT